MSDSLGQYMKHLEETRKKHTATLVGMDLAGDDMPWFFRIPVHHIHFSKSSGIKSALEDAHIRSLSDFAYHDSVRMPKLCGLNSRARDELSLQAPGIGIVYADQIDDAPLVRKRVKAGHEYWSQFPDLVKKYNPYDRMPEALAPGVFDAERENVKAIRELIGENKDSFQLPLAQLTKKTKLPESSALYKLKDRFILVGEVALRNAQELLEKEVLLKDIEPIDTDLQSLGLQLGMQDMANDIVAKRKSAYDDKILAQKIADKQAEFKKKYGL